MYAPSIAHRAPRLNNTALRPACFYTQQHFRHSFWLTPKPYNTSFHLPYRTYQNGSDREAGAPSVRVARERFSDEEQSHSGGSGRT